jgi:hypothetical protein
MLMELDELTRKRIEKLCDEILNEILHNPKYDVVNFASGMYSGILKLLGILNIKIKNINDFE